MARQQQPQQTQAKTTSSQANGSTNQVQQPAQKAANTPTHEQIARRAYEIFVARGHQHGRQMDDWLQAERELKAGKQ